MIPGMKVLVNAVTCNPTRGSESHFGWTAVRALSQNHDLWVLAHGNDRPAIESAVASGDLSPRVRFFYHHGLAKWGKNRLVSRLRAWRDYSIWSRSVEATAARLESEVGFDLIHHVTLSSWRVPCGLWKLGKPLVWGPVGGAEVFPWRLFPVISPPARGFEILRRLHGQMAFWSPAVRATARKSSIILSGNPETTALLRAIAGASADIRQVSAAFFNGSEMARFDGPKDFGGPLVLFAGGEVEGRKGIAIALDALALAKKNGLRFSYHVGGHGQEVEWLRKRALRLGLAGDLTIGRQLKGDEYLSALRRSHIYLLPSLRDNAPVTLMEAMLAGCVPVVANCGGPGWIVCDESGIRVGVTDARKMAEDVATGLLRLDSDRRLLAQLSDGAKQRIRSAFHEKNYLAHIEAAYREALRKKG
jgi:glycosyltransferase involved in cell wall biosynthesis